MKKTLPPHGSWGQCEKFLPGPRQPSDQPTSTAHRAGDWANRTSMNGMGQGMLSSIPAKPHPAKGPYCPTFCSLLGVGRGTDGLQGKAVPATCKAILRNTLSAVWHGHGLRTRHARLDRRLAGSPWPTLGHAHQDGHPTSVLRVCPRLH